jgi:dienelactone hydrolase
MLAPLFHAWERHLAAISKDRKVRPFDWGLEWLSPNGRGTSAAAEHVDRWVAGIMSDTHGFFSAPPTGDYDIQPPSAGAHQGETAVLRFPSAYVTPHQKNNTVHARWFPSAAGTPGRAVVILPQWNSDRGGHIGLSRLLARCGISALRLSLPYHDARMPPELSRADYIVSSNVVRTLQACRQAVLDARRAIDWLEDEGFDRVGMLGTSLGSCLSMLTTVHEPRVRAAALNHVSPWFADVVWRGLSTRHVRAGLDGHITLEQLRELWQPISPYAYLERQWPAHSLLVYASYDLTFPVDLSRTLVNAYKERGIAHDVAVLPCGHYSSGRAPFKFLDAWMLIRYLRRQLL